MAQKLKLLGVLTGLVMLVGCSTQTQKPSEPEADGDVWRKALPNTAIRDIRPEPRLPGMYEIIMGDKVVYGDATGRYLVFGHIYDVQANEDVTQARIDRVASARRIPWDSLPLQYAVRESRAPADAPKLAVLHANDCGWCRRLYHDVKSAKDERGDITRKGHELSVDVRLMILAPEQPEQRSGGADSSDYVMHEVADNIICGRSPEENLQAVMQDGFIEKFRADLQRGSAAPGGLARVTRPGAASPSETSCDSSDAIAAVRAFAKKHGLVGTPVLISGDGRVRRGYLPPDELLKWLNEGKENK